MKSVGRRLLNWLGEIPAEEDRGDRAPTIESSSKRPGIRTNNSAEFVGVVLKGRRKRQRVGQYPALS